MKQANLTATIWREDDSYVSFCPELGVASCGDSPDDALNMLKEAVELYLVNARQLGIWDEIKAALESHYRFSTSLQVAVP